jgi:hypothetical protein
MGELSATLLPPTAETMVVLNEEVPPAAGVVLPAPTIIV